MLLHKVVTQHVTGPSIARSHECKQWASLMQPRGLMLGLEGMIQGKASFDNGPGQFHLQDTCHMDMWENNVGAYDCDTDNSALLTTRLVGHCYSSLLIPSRRILICFFISVLKT